MRHILQVCCALYGLVGQASGVNLPNEGWFAVGGTPGLNGEVFAMAGTAVPKLDLSGSQDRIYIAGSFTQAGDRPASKIGYWQNHAFYSLATSVNGQVYAVAVLPDGSVVIGGSFSSVNGIPAHYVARWNGTQWAPLGSGTNGPVYAITSDTSGTVYLGGSFGTFNGQTANNVAKWSLSGVSGSLGGGTNSRVYALCWANNKLYVGGLFTSAGGQGYARVALWDPTQNRWFGLGSGIVGLRVSAIAADQTGNIYVGGEFTQAGGQSALNVAKWDGSSWSPLGQGLDGPVATLLCDSQGVVYAGGSFLSSGGQPMPQLARWTNGTWSSCGIAFDQSAIGPKVNALAIGPVTGDIYAAGRFQFADNRFYRNIARLTSRGWRQLRPGFDADVYALALDGLGDLYVGGSFSLAADGVTTALRAAKWDGQRWRQLGDGPDGSWEIRCFAWGPDDLLYAGNSGPAPQPVVAVRRLINHASAWENYGEFTTTGSAFALSLSPSRTLYAGGRDIFLSWWGNVGVAACLNGSWARLWSAYGDGVFALLHEPLGDIAVCDLYVGGDFIYDQSEYNIVKLRVNEGSGVAVRSCGGGLDGPVHALAKIGNVLYVGGSFSSTVSGSPLLRNIGAYTDTWHEVAGGVNAPVLTLAGGRNGELFAGGLFNNVGSQSLLAPYLAVFDGTTWGTVGQGCNGGVHRICRDGAGHIWVGGAFTEAGDLASPRLAYYATNAFGLSAADPLTTDGEQWAVGLGFTEPGLTENYWSQDQGALFARVYANSSRFRVTGRLSRPALWLPYAAIGSDRYVRAKFYVYATGSDDWQSTGAMPNMRLRVAHRFAQTAMLEVFNHTNVDPEASSRFGREIRPSTNPAAPSLYFVDMDPVDVPFLAENAQTEGVACGFEAYAIDPQDEGEVALAEAQLGTYQALEDIGSPAQIYAPSANDAGTLAVRDPNTDLSMLALKPGTGVGEFPIRDTNTSQPLYSEGSWGICLDTRPVLASRYGVIQREFWPGDYTDRIRVAPGKIYKIRYHVTSPQLSNRQSQMRLRARTVRYLWCQKFEIGGALGAGPENNLCAAQSLPGIGCMNPDKIGSENGGWYTLLMHSPLDERIRADYPAATPLSISMPNLSAEPAMGENAYSFRDLRVCFDDLDTLSGSAMSGLEEGCFVLDRIEVRGYFDVWD
ncbi:MAG: hypothetical protein ACP5UB_11690 [Candidatus Sumerlaeaceae bacterium]